MQNIPDVCKRIFEMLEERRISVSEFARMLGISQGAVSGWKNRGSAPSVELIPRICTIIDVSADWLLTGENKNIVSSNSKLSMEANELLRIYETLDVKKRIRLLETAFSIEDEQA